MQPLGVHHVSLNVNDAAIAVAFYTEMLGCTLRADRPDFGFGGAWLDVGNQQVHLLEVPMPDDRGQHFAIQVADLDATVAELRANGVTVGDPSSVASSRQAFLHDPAGNLIELHQVG